MKYRYFSTQRPVAPGTFPKSRGAKFPTIRKSSILTEWVLMLGDTLITMNP